MKKIAKNATRKERVRRILVHMRYLVRRGWTKNASARSSNNRIVEVDSPRAVLFCMAGACDRSAWDLNLGVADRIRASDILQKYVKTEKEGPLVTVFNDAKGTRKTDVLRVIDAAIRSCS